MRTAIGVVPFLPLLLLACSDGGISREALEVIDQLSEPDPFVTPVNSPTGMRVWKVIYHPGGGGEALIGRVKVSTLAVSLSVPLAADGDAADLYRTITGKQHPTLKGKLSAEYKAFLEKKGRRRLR